MRKFTWQALAIRQALEDQRLSQGDAQYLIFGHRKQAQVISNWCRGKQGVPAKHLNKICQTLGISRIDFIEAKLKDEREFLEKTVMLRP